jgi:hypothetical protein
MLTANGYKPAARAYDDDIEDSGIAPDLCAGEIITNDSQSITIGIHAQVEWVDGYGPVLSFDRTEIGNPERFNVVFASASGPDGDRAPDAGSWSFSVTPFALEVRTSSLGPARAGKTLTARALVLRSDFDSPLTEGQIDCRAKVAGHALRGRGSFQGNRVLCSWRLPTSADGQRLGGTITVVFQNVEARRAFVSRVR